VSQQHIRRLLLAHSASLSSPPTNTLPLVFLATAVEEVIKRQLVVVIDTCVDFASHATEFDSEDLGFLLAFSPIIRSYIIISFVDEEIGTYNPTSDVQNRNNGIKHRANNSFEESNKCCSETNE
jgi:hypothetical protein